MKIKALLSLLAFFQLYALSAQELTYEPLEAIMSDSRGSTDRRYDNNGTPCARIRVMIPQLQDLSINCNYGIVGDIAYTPGEYVIYVPEGAKRIEIKHPNFLPCTVKFPPVQSLVTYKLVLRLPENNTNATIVRLKTNVQKATLKIGGKVFDTDNAEFNVPLPAGEYDYTVSTNLAGFMPILGHASISGKDVVCELPKAYLTTAENRSLSIFSDSGVEIFIDGKSVGKSKGIIVQTVSAGIHTIEAKFGKSGSWYLKREKDLSSGNDSVSMLMRGTLSITSPQDAEFTIEPLGESIVPEKKKFKSGQTIPLLGQYKIIVRKKGYNDTQVNVNVMVGDQLLNYHIKMTSEADNLYYGLNGKKMDREKAVKTYQKLADAGDDQAAYQLGQARFDLGDNAGALQYWRKAAKSGNEMAYIAIYEHSSDLTERISFAKKSVEAGNKDALPILADFCLDNGQTEEAFVWYKRADDAGYESVAAKLGECYYQGWGSEKDYKKAVELFESSREQSALSRERLADCSYFGLGKPMNKKVAIAEYKTLYDTGVASDDVRYRLALNQYHNGNKTQDDRDREALYCSALDIVQSISDQNYLLQNNELNVSAFERIGNFLFKKKNRKATDAFMIAILKGSEKAEVFNHIGLTYYLGQGGEKDLATAIEWLSKASEMGSGEGSGFLGLCYQEQQQYNKALSAFKKAIEQGYVSANGYIGTFYSKGWGVSKNLDTAVSYWIIAAQAGHKPSIKNLVKYYDFKKNTEEANRWRALQ